MHLCTSHHFTSLAVGFAKPDVFGFDLFQFEMDPAIDARLTRAVSGRAWHADTT